MAQIKFNKAADYAVELGKLAEDMPGIVHVALYEAAGVVADQIREAIAALPYDRHRFLRGDDTFGGISRLQKGDLLAGLGVSPHRLSGYGDWTVIIGFNGYGTKGTKTYPDGVPNMMLARSIESGSSVRRKIPFVRQAVAASRGKALAVMETAIMSEIEKRKL